MKVKMQITLLQHVLQAIDELSDPEQNHSEFIEAALRVYIADKRRQTRDARDLAILNGRADALNEEALDVLTYQVDV